jgi:hypothetical protein
MRLSKLTTFSAVLFLVSACSNGQPSPNIGYISLTSRPDPMSYGYASFIARPASTCTESMIGACVVQECFDLKVSGPRPQHNAGAITVEGVEMDAGFVFTYGNEHCLQNCPAYQYPSVPKTGLWRGGETLTASAPGGDVPAFSGKTVTAPNEITVTSPTCTTDAGLPWMTSCSVSRTEDLTITWTGGAGTAVHALLTSGSKNRLLSLSCRFASSPGTIPAEAMAKLGKSGDEFTNYLRVNASNQTTFTVGSYDVILEANNMEFMNFVTTSN